jgi:hypothetical protein
MTQTIIDNGAYSERVTASPIAALKGQFHVHIETQCKGAKDPDAWRTAYRITCDQWGLENLGKEIYEALRSDRIGHSGGA